MINFVSGVHFTTDGLIENWQYKTYQYIISIRNYVNRKVLSNFRTNGVLDDNRPQTSSKCRCLNVTCFRLLNWPTIVKFYYHHDWAPSDRNQPNASKDMYMDHHKCYGSHSPINNLMFLQKVYCFLFFSLTRRCP